jgi:acetyl esterase/lipase
MIDHFHVDDYKWKISDYGDIEDDMLTLHAVLELKGLLAQLPPLYMGEEKHVCNPLAAPLFQKTLQGLPKTLMVLCEYDYLRLSAETFCRKMVRDGVDCRTLLYCGVDHAFIDKIGHYPQVYDLATELAYDIKR